VLVYIGLMLGLFLSSLDQTIVTTALKAIVEDLGDQPLIPWLGSAYLLTAAPVQTLYGKFADIFGRKWVFVFAISVFEIGSLICGAATSMAMLIAGRAIAGIGGGGIFSCVIIIISDIVSIRDRGKYQGAFGAVFGLASVVAPLAGGLFVDHATWRWCFYLNLPLGAITLYTIIFMFPKDAVEGTFRDKIARVDFLGGLAVCAATVALITPLQLGGSTWEWNSAPVYAMFVAAAVLAAVFVYIELKIAKEPIVPAGLFINSSVVVLLIIGVLMGAVFFGGFYFVTLYFQIVFGQSATQAGLSLVPLVIGLIFTSIGSGLFVSRYGKYKLFFFIGPVLLSGGIGLMSSLDASSVEWMRFIYLMVFGMAMGSMMQMRIIALQSSVPRELIAVGTAVAQTAQSLGSALGVAIIGTLFNNCKHSQ
ncbi:MFS general substrate transporter, partial [Rhizoclosmatium globosum]